MEYEALELKLSGDLRGWQLTSAAPTPWLLFLVPDNNHSLSFYYYYFFSPGLYSQKIFKKLDYTVLSSLRYSDFKNKKGEEFLTDTREHEEIITCYKKLNV